MRWCFNFSRNKKKNHVVANDRLDVFKKCSTGDNYVLVKLYLCADCPLV